MKVEQAFFKHRQSVYLSDCQPGELIEIGTQHPCIVTSKRDDTRGMITICYPHSGHPEEFHLGQPVYKVLGKVVDHPSDYTPTEEEVYTL